MFYPLLVALSLSTWGLSFKQEPFSALFEPGKLVSADHYEFQWPIRRVAIIGAGPSGMIAYREFTREGFEVQVFERDDVPGGNWHYTEETPVDAPIPNAPIEVGDYKPSLPPDGVQLPYTEEYSNEEWSELRREHRGPKPVWASLRSNAPAPWQQITELPWPTGTPWELTHEMLQKYMRSFASFHGINSNDGNRNVSFNTRVELVEKRYNDEGKEAGWKLTLKELTHSDAHSTKATWFTEDFDAVIVATGRFTAPYIPPIPGLTEWAKRFPDRISHSRQYRRPEGYANETILIVGAATSGGEISRDLNPHAAKIYQSIRPDNSSVPHFQLSNFLRRLPANTSVVPEIKSFHPISSQSDITSGRIELSNGTVLTDIDRIIFATGFRFSFPFIPQYHNSSIGLNESATGGAIQPLITDGTHIRSLHLDLFYIEEPTIGFLDMNLGMQSFIYGEYLSLALARVWGNKANLPSTPRLWRSYEDHVKEVGGYGRHFQFLGSERTEANVRYFVGWLNAAAIKLGGRQIDGLPQGGEDIAALWSAARFGRNILLGEGDDNASANSAFTRGSYPVDFFALGQGEMKKLVYDAIFNDYW